MPDPLGQTVSEVQSTPQPVPADTGPRARWPDAVLGTLVVVVAFLVASFPARNSDLWLHLAAGRLLANGDYTFGTDPFAYTTQDVYWANHAWLFDLALYTVHQSLGGPTLVMLKAVAVFLLAALMICTTRSTGPFWVSGGCVLLAILAMSPRLLLQPACLSVLLLSLSLWLLVAGGRARFALPVVMALWVNLDSWFLLGPLLVLIFAVGQRLARTQDGANRVPLWLPFACLAACLLSPHHVHALTLPPELSPAVWNSDLRHDVRFAALFASPWQLAPLGPSRGYSLSAWAYFVLLALGAVSFTVNRSACRSWRLPVWIAFGALGAWQVRLIPFFAVVAGPITGLNLREGRVGWSRPMLGRTVLALGSIGLIALTWPGWLQGFGRDDRPLAWDVQPDQGLRQAAERRAAWRRSGLLDDSDRAFHAHPDSAHYAAWFSPSERVFLDLRLNLFVHVAGEYRTISEALGLAGGGGEWFPADARAILRDRKVSYLVVHDPDVTRLQAALRRFWVHPVEIPLIQLEGREATFGWATATRSGVPFERWQLDLDSLAFQPPEEDDRAPPAAPGNGISRDPHPPSFWREFAVRSQPRAADVDTAALLLGYVDEQTKARAPAVFADRIRGYAAGLVGATPREGGPLGLAQPTIIHLEVFDFRLTPEEIAQIEGLAAP